MVRTIKFRGTDALNKPFYGVGAFEYGGKYYVVIRSDRITMALQSGSEPVQLIGLDKNGAEVYEGDKVIRETFIDDEGNEHEVLEAFPMAATFEDFSAIENGEIMKVKVGNEND